MSKRLVPIVQVTSLLLLAATVLVAESKTFPRTTVHYSASQTVEMPSMTMAAKIWAQPGKMRVEADVNGQKTTSILREDLNVVWMLQADGASYLEVALDAGGSGGGLPFGTELLVFEKTGTDTIEGRRADRYRFESQAGGMEAKGEVWLTAENIPLRMTTEQGITMSLTDIVLETQPDQLFELPAGAKKMSF